MTAEKIEAILNAIPFQGDHLQAPQHAARGERMRNEHALMGIYAPFTLPAGVIIPDEVQDYIREQMMPPAPVIIEAPELVMNIDPRIPKARQRRNEQAVEIRRMLAEGATNDAMAKALGVSTAHIVRVKRERHQRPRMQQGEPALCREIQKASRRTIARGSQDVQHRHDEKRHRHQAQNNAAPRGLDPGRGKGGKMTDDQLLTMLQLRDNGWSLTQVADRFGMTKGKVGGLLFRIDKDSAKAEDAA